MELFSPGHLIPLLIIAAIVFFGWKQLPDMARSAGKSLRIFRTEIKGLSDPDATEATKSALSSVSEQPAAAPTSAVVPPVVVPSVVVPAATTIPAATPDAPPASGTPTA